MTIIAEQYTHVVGVDTHARTHTFSMLAATTGAVIGTDMFPTTGAGMSRAVEWIFRRTQAGNVLVAVDGKSSYRARLTRLLEAERFAVCEARPPRRQSRRAHGKSDAIDAVAAARTVPGRPRPNSSAPGPRVSGKHCASSWWPGARRTPSAPLRATR